MSFLILSHVLQFLNSMMCLRNCSLVDNLLLFSFSSRLWLLSSNSCCFNDLTWFLLFILYFIDAILLIFLLLRCFSCWVRVGIVWVFVLGISRE